MSDAAERIWIGLGMPGYISDEPALDLYDVEYIRADIHEAKIKELEFLLRGARDLNSSLFRRLVKEPPRHYSSR